jgi:hypothetical protein
LPIDLYVLWEIAMKPSHYERLFSILGLAGLAAAVACQSSEQRTAVSGTGFEGVVESSADAAPADKVGGTGDGKGSAKGSGGASQLTGKSLEQCSAEKKAWRAVVDSGNAPSECSEALVSWCCTSKEVLARFPTMAEKIRAEFAKYIDQEQHVLYHCSSDGGTKTTFHLAKIAGTQVFYRTIYVDKVFPVETGSKNDDCPVVVTKDLNISESPAPETEVGAGEETEVVDPSPPAE